MNKLIVIILICLGGFSTTVNAQEFKFGLKGGINKPYGGQITGIDSGVPTDYTSDTFTAEGEIGLQGGIWAQLTFGKFFIRPEAGYSKLETIFPFPQGPAVYNVDMVSVPLLIGYNVWGPLDIYAGPSYNVIMSSSIDRLEPLNDPPTVVVQNFPLSAQVGAKVEFGSFGLDIRYDRSLATREGQANKDFVSDNSDFTFPVLNRANIDDARLNQIIVSLTVKLFDTENAGKRRRRGGSCYF